MSHDVYCFTLVFAVLESFAKPLQLPKRIRVVPEAIEVKHVTVLGVERNEPLRGISVKHRVVAFSTKRVIGLFSKPWLPHICDVSKEACVLVETHFVAREAVMIA